MSRWWLAARVACHALALVTIFLCLVLPTSRYDWVGGLDPAVRPADLAGGDDSAVTIGMFAVLAPLVEGTALVTGRTRQEWIVSAALIVAVCGAWLWRSIT